MIQSNDMKLHTVGEWIQKRDLEGSHDVHNKKVWHWKSHGASAGWCVVFFQSENYVMKSYVSLESQ